MPVNEESRDSITVIDGYQIKTMINSALSNLKEQQSLIDSLNVFPVPDGDTGTNMYLTLKEAVDSIRDINSPRVDEITSSLARGALMGARGNSGVILSQILRGFSRANSDKSFMEAGDLVKSLKLASEIAYQGVLKPVEGTILTVSRKAAEGAELAHENDLDISGILTNAIEAARRALDKTPEQLPELKEAEVVDAGGKGYVVILEGLKAGLTEQPAETEGSGTSSIQVVPEETTVKKEPADRAELEYKYCTQTLIYTDKTRYEVNIDQIRKDLQRYGDSLMVVGSDRIVKVHIHTNHPGVVLENALNYGSLNDINIDNMEIQNESLQEHHHPELEEELEGGDEEKEADTPVIESESGEVSDNNQQSAEPDKEEKVGIIAVGKGQGIKNIFKQLSVDMVIDGGQSMNPSTNDFVEAIAEISSNKILILPNNKNIISAAQQAASLADKEVEVVSTRSIPQAISSLLAFNGEVELSRLKENMEQEIESVKTLEITTAVKNSRVNGLEIEEGDIIGLYNDDIVVAGDSYQEVVLDLLTKTKQDEELMTIYYGEEITEDEVGDLLAYIHREIDIEEIETYNGGQPLYPYILSLE